MLRLYRRKALLPQEISEARVACRRVTGQSGVAVTGEACFYIETARALTEAEREIIRWHLAETFEPGLLTESTHLGDARAVIEIGPRLNVETAWASTALTILRINGVDAVTRMERARRFGFDVDLTDDQRQAVAAALHDPMVETIYANPLGTFATGLVPAPVETIALCSGGIDELRRVNRERGLAMDEHDMERFVELFTVHLKRDPTDVELFQLAQGNSEHCRHGFFKARLILDGAEQPASLMEIVKEPWQRNPNNSVIAFHDDSSAIAGGRVRDLVATAPGDPGPLDIDERTYHLTLTAETHNHPSGVAPYPGAATGGGGRIRDNQAVGRGGIVQVGGAAYCTADLGLGEDPTPTAEGVRARGLAAPLDILIQASNGASDYGNCFGEPLVYGFVRTLSIETREGLRAWLKPVMYSVGAGQIDERHVAKGGAEAGLLIVQIGGPAYRIGMGGGAASSLAAGENAAELDFDSVQRGNPEMEQRMGRVIRACIELGDANPIVSAHDLGAGGDCNALPELAYPAGARIDLRALPVGDQSLSVLEIWGNESQERNAVLIRRDGIDVLRRIAARERAPLDIVGEVTGDGRLVLADRSDGSHPVDLPLEPVLGDVPPKEISLESAAGEPGTPLDLGGVNVGAALDAVLRLPAIAAKSYLTRKVDRCVTGRVAQQQCVGPNHLPLADFAATAQSLFGVTGAALSLGEQPLKGLVDPAAMARMAVAEALLNMAGAKITQRADIRCSANWMWPAKLPGEGARMLAAATAMRDIMISLGIAVDGGKDSLSMAATTTSGEVVKAPGQLVIAAYAPMPDVTVRVTPDLKRAGDGLILADLSGGQARLGGSALAQSLGQVGDAVPDIADPRLLAAAFDTIQDLVERGAVTAVHDRSDGGLIVAAAEMAFTGNRGLDLDLADRHEPVAALFAEEAGVLLESADPIAVVDAFAAVGVPARVIGTVGERGGRITVRHNAAVLIDAPMTDLRAAWEDTATRIDALQADPDCVAEEAGVMRDLVDDPAWTLTFEPAPTPADGAAGRPRVAVIRDQGSNGDRELAAAFHAAGFDVWDVTMTDLIAGRVSLEGFRGVAFPGGFSYGDVLDAGKAWAGIIRFHPDVAAQFDRFVARPDTFSLGVCNGAQLMALLGWVPQPGTPGDVQPRFVRNRSGRFECRLTTVEITPSPSIFLRGMAGSRLGVWVAHGEGRLLVPGGTALDPALTPMRYVTPAGDPTETYPFNPNGSPGGATALCSADGRHLALMPHPERLANQLWQWPWLPDEWRGLPVSPWLRLFQNARDWCLETAPPAEVAALNG